MTEDKGIDSHLRSIHDLLYGKILIVPSHQRWYAWDKKHINDMLTDIDNAISEKQPEYLLGSIFVTKVKNNQSEIIDGQQRIATIMVLLSAIRDYLASSSNSDDKEFASSITLNYLIEKLSPKKHTPRLQLSVEDNEFFLKKILYEPKSSQRNKIKAKKESHKKIVAAAELARDYISHISQRADSTKLINDLVEYIGNSLKVILVLVPNEANAFTIFETLNDRGLALRIFEKLKNHLFALADDEIAEVQQRWTSMISALEAHNWRESFIEHYIHHFWSSRHGLVREKNLYSNIKERVQSRKDTLEFVRELAENTKLYIAICYPEPKFWQGYGENAFEYMNTLNLLRMTQIRPLLLSILSSKFHPAEVQKTLRLLVNWSVRLTVTRALGSSALEQNYSGRAKDVRDGKIQTINQLKLKLKKIIPTDAKFKRALYNFLVSNSNLARYFLRVLEMQERGEKHPEFVPIDDVKAVNLEHVLPRNPSSSWDVSDQDRQTYTDMLGNLVLLKTPLNIAAGNDSFTVKKEIYKKSQYMLTSEVAQNKSWGPHEIEERQHKLAELAVKAWSLD